MKTDPKTKFLPLFTGRNNKDNRLLWYSNNMHKTFQFFSTLAFFVLYGKNYTKAYKKGN